jgi:hypothetical protein
MVWAVTVAMACSVVRVRQGAAMEAEDEFPEDLGAVTAVVVKVTVVAARLRGAGKEAPVGKEMWAMEGAVD